MNKSKKEMILDFIASDFDKAKIKKTLQSSLMKLNDPIKVSAQLSRILDGDIDILKEEEIDLILRNIKDLNFNKKETSNAVYEKPLGITEINKNTDIELKKKDEEIERLRLELRNEREVRKKLESIIYLTKKQSIENSSDDDINELYLKYLSSGEEQFRSAIVAKNKNTTIIPKTYYVIK